MRSLLTRASSPRWQNAARAVAGSMQKPSTAEKRSARKREKMHSDNRKGLMGRIGKHVSADTLELIALYVFVALPLPGTGVWTGSAIATLFEMPRGKSAIAILLGNATACLITMLMTMGVKAVV